MIFDHVLDISLATIICLRATFQTVQLILCFLDLFLDLLLLASSCGEHLVLKLRISLLALTDLALELHHLRIDVLLQVLELIFFLLSSIMAEFELVMLDLLLLDFFIQLVCLSMTVFVLSKQNA